MRRNRKNKMIPRSIKNNIKEKVDKTARRRESDPSFIPAFMRKYGEKLGMDSLIFANSTPPDIHVQDGRSCSSFQCDQYFSGGNFAPEWKAVDQSDCNDIWWYGSYVPYDCPYNGNDYTWYDSYGWGCVDFDNFYYCINTDYEYDMNCGLTAWEACCECNGGTANQLTGVYINQGSWPSEVSFTVYDNCGSQVLTGRGNDSFDWPTYIYDLDIDNMAVCLCESYGDGLNGFRMDFFTDDKWRSFGDTANTWGTLESGTPFSCNCHTVGDGVCGGNCPMAPSYGATSYTCLNTGKHNGGQTYYSADISPGHDNMHCSGLPGDWESNWNSWKAANCPSYTDSDNNPADCENYRLFGVESGRKGCNTKVGTFFDGTLADYAHWCPRQCWAGCDASGFFPSGPQCGGDSVDFRQTKWKAGYDNASDHCGESSYWAECTPIPGCTDPNCSGYNPAANIHDEASCGNIRDCFGVCGGSAVVDECGICNGQGYIGDTCNNCDYLDSPYQTVPDFGTQSVTINGVTFSTNGYCNCHGGVTDGCGDCVCSTGNHVDCGTWAGKNWFDINCNDDDLYNNDGTPRPDVLSGTFDAFCGCPSADGQPRCQSDGIGGLECRLPNTNPQAYCWHPEATNCGADISGGQPIDLTPTVSVTYSNCQQCPGICIGSGKDIEEDECFTVWLMGNLPCDETEWNMTHCWFEVACANPDYNGYDCRCAPGGLYGAGNCYTHEDSISACGTYMGTNGGLDACGEGTTGSCDGSCPVFGEGNYFCSSLMCWEGPGNLDVSGGVVYPGNCAPWYYFTNTNPLIGNESWCADNYDSGQGSGYGPGHVYGTTMYWNWYHDSLRNWCEENGIDDPRCRGQFPGEGLPTE